MKFWDDVLDGDSDPMDTDTQGIVAQYKYDLVVSRIQKKKLGNKGNWYRKAIIPSQRQILSLSLFDLIVVS